MTMSRVGGRERDRERQGERDTHFEVLAVPVRPFVFVVYAGAHAGVRPLYLPGVPCSMARQQHAVERPRVELAAEMRPATPYSGARVVSSLRAPLRAPSQLRPALWMPLDGSPSPDLGSPL